MDSLLSLSPTLSDAYYNRGVAWINLGNIDRACSDFRKSQELGSKINKDFVEYECNPEFTRIHVKAVLQRRKSLPRIGLPATLYTCGYAECTPAGANMLRCSFLDLNVRIIPKKKIVAITVSFSVL
jgi:hypothetical protein